MRIKGLLRAGSAGVAVQVEAFDEGEDFRRAEMMQVSSSALFSL